MFKDRFDAAHQLAQQLIEYKDNKDVVIIAIPRGGLELGSVLSKELNAPLDILLTKKIGAPFQPEVAIGSASLNHAVIDNRFADLADIYHDYIVAEIQQIRKNLQKRSNAYRGQKKPVSLKNKIIILTDDGVATGHTMLSAIDLIKQEHPKELIVAIPVAPAQTAEKIREGADKLICLMIPANFYSVSQFYQSFNQVEDDEAIRLLTQANL